MSGARSSAASVCSFRSGGLITSWSEFERWARSIEGAEVAQLVESDLAAADVAHHPHAPGYAPIAVLVDCVAALLSTKLPDAWRLRIARFSGLASRALREGRCSPEARATARELLERPLRDLLAAIRAVRTAARSEAA